MEWKNFNFLKPIPYADTREYSSFQGKYFVNVTQTLRGHPE